MKFLATSTSTLALATIIRAQDSANDSSNDASLPDGRRYNSIVEMAYSQVTTNYDRRSFENRISKYGCHCFPGDTRAAGGPGPRVDSLDEECWSLSKCHKCVLITYGDSNLKTNLKSMDRFDHYNWSLLADGTISCDNKKNDAKKSLCECDKAFAERMKTTWNDNLPNDFYWKSNKNVKNNPTFDYESTCVPAGAGVTADSCCGTGFPNMEPYSSANNKDCCQDSGAIFNSLTHECCADGSGVQTIGAC